MVFPIKTPPNNIPISLNKYSVNLLLLYKVPLLLRIVINGYTLVIVIYSVTISIIIKILITDNKFELLKIYKNNILINFKIRTTTNVFFNLFNFTYFPIKAMAITLIKVPKLIILLIFETENELSYNHNCLKVFQSPIEILKKANINNILFSFLLKTFLTTISIIPYLLSLQKNHHHLHNAFLRVNFQLV